MTTKSDSAQEGRDSLIPSSQEPASPEGHAVAPHAVEAQEWPRCKFANGGARCVSHCGDAVCIAEALTTCNCRWQGDELVQQCTLHEAWRDAIHEWAERAKTAERELAIARASAQEQLRQPDPKQEQAPVAEALKPLPRIDLSSCIDGDLCAIVSFSDRECGEMVYRDRQPIVYEALARISARLAHGRRTLDAALRSSARKIPGPVGDQASMRVCGVPEAEKQGSLVQAVAISGEAKRLREALERLCRNFPTDTDMEAAGWDGTEIQTACDAYDAARAALSAQPKEA